MEWSFNIDTGEITFASDEDRESYDAAISYHARRLEYIAGGCSADLASRLAREDLAQGS